MKLNILKQSRLLQEVKEERKEETRCDLIYFPWQGMKPQKLQVPEASGGSRKVSLLGAAPRSSRSEHGSHCVSNRRS